MITARPSENLQAVADRIKKRGGVAEVCAGDVGRNDDMAQAVASAISALGSVDIAIANVGIYSETWPENFNATEYLSIMDINFGGLVRTLNAVLPYMLASGKGTVVGTASVAGFRGLPRAAAYAASKSAMIAFRESIRFHLRHRGIKVVVVNPGFVLTRLTQQNEFFMPSLLMPERAAEYFCDGLEREKDVISFPPVFAAFLALVRIVPFKLYDALTTILWQKLKNPRRRTTPVVIAEGLSKFR